MYFIIFIYFSFNTLAESFTIKYIPFLNKQNSHTIAYPLDGFYSIDSLYLYIGDSPLDTLNEFLNFEDNLHDQQAVYRKNNVSFSIKPLHNNFFSETQPLSINSFLNEYNPSEMLFNIEINEVQIPKPGTYKYSKNIYFYRKEIFSNYNDEFILLETSPFSIQIHVPEELRVTKINIDTPKNNMINNINYIIQANTGFKVMDAHTNTTIYSQKHPTPLHGIHILIPSKNSYNVSIQKY